MKRLVTILVGYAASSVAAMVVLVMLGWIDSGSLSFDRIGYIAPLFVGGAWTGALYSLPIAIPTILFTEITGKRSPWIFVAAGLATAALMIGRLGAYSMAEILALQPYVVRDLSVVTLVTLTASLTYWFVAWKLYPPHSPNPQAAAPKPASNEPASNQSVEQE